MNNFIEELKWRGLIHDFTPGIQKFLNEKFRSAYIGFDPTSDSLHIGNLVPIMLLSQTNCLNWWCHWNDRGPLWKII